MAHTQEIRNSGKFASYFDRWSLAAMLIGFLVLLPIVSIVFLAFFPKENIWPHLMATSLPRYISNSLYLMVGISTIAGVIGVSCAWFVVTKEFPLRKHLEWALLFPLAIPAYIGAYTFVDFWEFAGPFQTQLRDIFGWTTSKDYWFPAVRSHGAALFVISLSLYPYIYLLARAAFRDQSNRTIEVSQALGVGSTRTFFLVALPLARPAIAVGVALVMMESLNDFGAVEYFAVQTLTTGIFTVWLEASNAGGAAQIAVVILVLLAGLVLLERKSRDKMRVHQRGNQSVPPSRTKMVGVRAFGLTFICALPVIFGFIMPLWIMVSHAIHTDNVWMNAQFLGAAWTSIWVALTAAFITVAAAIVLVYAVRVSRSKFVRRFAPIATIGYAAPGAVLAVGILLPMAYFDHWLADLVEGATGVDIGLLITGTASAVILAYFVRFFALAYGTIDSAMGRFSPNIGHAARSLGQSPMGVLKRVQLPMIRSSVLIGMLLVFVDGVKELPATLLLRPFGFETLSTQIYNAATVEDIKGASAASIAVILVGMIAVGIIARASRR